MAEIQETVQVPAPTYEELVQAYNQLADDRQFRNVQTRLSFDIEVLKLADHFPAAYIKEVVADIIKLLPMEAYDEKQAAKKTTKKAAKTE